MKKKLIIILLPLLILGGVYKFVIAKPKAEAKPKVEGTVYILPKEFLLNLQDSRFVKLSVGLVLSHDDKGMIAAGGHGASPPEGYGPGPQEAIIRDIITDEVTNLSSDELTSKN